MYTKALYSCKEWIYGLTAGMYPMRTSTQIREKISKSLIHFCQSEIHKLPYCPEGSSLPCSAAVERLNNFIKNNEIDLVFYKGGDIEKKVCDKLHINSFNIENFMNELEKVYSHDPYIEVNCYFTQLVEFFL